VWGSFYFGNFDVFCVNFLLYNVNVLHARLKLGLWSLIWYIECSVKNEIVEQNFCAFWNFKIENSKIMQHLYTKAK
jgi:hypothetical protein